MRAGATGRVAGRSATAELEPRAPEPRAPEPRTQEPRAAEPLALAELICARLCHDLSGAVGMLTALLELATSPAREAGEALSEARQTAADLSVRLVVLRAAWTAAGEDLGAARLRAMLAPFLRQRRIEADLSQLDEHGWFEPAVGRAVLNAVLLCVESLPRGGLIAASGEPDGGVLLSIQGPGAAWPAALHAAGLDPAAALAAVDDPRCVQPQLTAAVAAAAGLRLSLLPRTGAGPPERLLLHRQGPRAPG